MLKWFQGLFSNDLAVDLGTSSTLIFAKGHGIVTNEPTVVAVSRGRTGSRRLVAVGRAAKEMVGRTPDGIEAIKPVKNGVIADFESAKAMLHYFIKQAHNARAMAAPRIIICVPVTITEVEKRAFREAALTAGAREVYLIEEPMAAAIGAGLPVAEPSGNMIVDIGGGTTEVAVISLSGIVFSKSTRVGGDKMDEAIVQYAKRRYNLLLGDQTAEDVKKRIGSAFPTGKIQELEVKGRDLVGGVPKTVVLNSEEIRDALADCVKSIVEAVRFSLERTPPELAADIVDRGLMLSGGGAQLRELDVLLREETGLPILISDDPEGAVARGSGAALDNIDLLGNITVE